MVLTGCPLEGDNGKIGVQGAQGQTGAKGDDGIYCWDLNEDSINYSDEDVNNDGRWNVNDCAISQPPVQSSMVELNHQHF